MKGYISTEALIKDCLTVLAAIVVFAFVAQLPELIRYMKIRSM
jgi:hypothetical protein